MNLQFEYKVKTKKGWMIPINFAAGGVAATLKTSNHRAGNITHPEGGRAEMGILCLYEEE